MQFTKAEEYGMFGALYLAEMETDRVIPLSEISQAMDNQMFLQGVQMKVNQLDMQKE